MKYRKKPVVIEAIQVKQENLEKIWTWMGDSYESHSDCAETGIIMIPIKTLEGEMTASKDDWIIKGIKGEFYPCKPDIFESTYEKVDE